ncbi:DNA polymerase III subunit delta [uncultured Desulfovibrio sp.]|uniref:DNA polymerase III subunit delta n=1 Tax=uncultured Desulfovibrio sp. TaxID=167968 RepID=UPI0025D5AA59|nr:DNA polymerase III subunit delta [uncultured Desulfovibrio sp.]
MSHPGFTFLICPDSRLLQAHMEGLLSSAKADSRWERHVYWGDEDPPPRFWEQLTLQGLFGTPRVLVARQAHLWPAAVWKKISAALGHPSDQCWPFFCLEVAWERGQPKIPAHLAKLRCFAYAEQQGWVWRNEGLTERGLRRHVQERATALGLRFAPDALEQFCASVPVAAQAVENELQKLLLLAPADTPPSAASPLRVDVAMLATASWSPDCNVFALIRHLEAANLPAVWKELERGRRDGDSLIFSLLALLAREFRQLWQLLAGEKVRLSPTDAGAKQQLARRLGFDGLSQGLALIMDTEWQIKSGRRSPEQCLDFLAAELCRLFARGRS